VNGPLELSGAQLEELADQVAAILLARQNPKRDLASEIESWLAENEPGTFPEIALGISARESAVRYLLTTDDRFQARACGPGRSPKAKCWQLATPDDPTQPRPRRSGSEV
jgi:hypothetical protein